ncbi:MAG: DNA-directed RNA polymerase subunit B, partial [Desulfurococcales archaeon]|nr:DNA-directed RNA polymerase subunit B [Desulfurococcales archaeon]
MPKREDSGSSKTASITVEDLWPVYNSFIKSTGLARQHLDSYNQLVSRKIQEMIDSIGEITPAWRMMRRRKGPLPPNLPDIRIKISEVRFGHPEVKSAGYSTRIYPLDCRMRNLSYVAPLFVKATLIVNGHVKEKDKEVKIADFPVMVKSVIDPLSRMSEEELTSIGEDPYDPGGYFIINGSEKVVVIQEDLAVNRIIVGPAAAGTAKITHSAKVVSTMLGVRRQVIVDRMSDGSLEVSMSRLNARIPFVILMRALGFVEEREIAYAVSPDPDVQQELVPSFEKVAHIARTQEEALEYIGNRLASGQPREKRIERALEFLDNQFLPHLGNKPEDREKKAFFLAEMANRVL